MINSELEVKERERRRRWAELRKQKRGNRENTAPRKSRTVARVNQKPKLSPKDILNCKHHQGFSRYTPCKSCCGTVQTKIYVCDVWGECSFYSKAGAGIKYCFDCDERD